MHTHTQSFFVSSKWGGRTSWLQGQIQIKSRKLKINKDKDKPLIQSFS